MSLTALICAVKFVPAPSMIASCEDLEESILIHERRSSEKPWCGARGYKLKHRPGQIVIEREWNETKGIDAQKVAMLRCDPGTSQPRDLQIQKPAIDFKIGLQIGFVIFVPWKKAR